MRIFIIILSVIFQFSFALVFVSSPPLLVDNLLNQYTLVQERSNLSSHYIHTEIKIKDNYISNESTNFIRNNKSRSKQTVTYYSLFSKNFDNPVFTTENYYSTPTILYNPYRYDLGNKYFETFRLRQEFSGVDSRVIEQGLDFTIQISNIEADKILIAKGLNNDYSYFLDNKVEVFLNYDNTEYKGVITNLFYIEEEEPISIELSNYNGNFSLIIPNPNLEKTLNFKLNHDFINNSMLIKRETSKLNGSFDKEEIQFFSGKEIDFKLNEIYNTLFYKKSINLYILFFSLFGIIISGTGLFFLVYLMNKKTGYVGRSFVRDILVSVFVFSTILYILKRIFVTGFFFMLSNLFSGLLTVILILFSIIYLYKKGKYKTNEKE